MNHTNQFTHIVAGALDVSELDARKPAAVPADSVAGKLPA